MDFPVGVIGSNVNMNTVEPPPPPPPPRSLNFWPLGPVYKEVG